MVYGGCSINSSISIYYCGCDLQSILPFKTVLSLNYCSAVQCHLHLLYVYISSLDYKFSRLDYNVGHLMHKAIPLSQTRVVLCLTAGSGRGHHSFLAILSSSSPLSWGREGDIETKTSRPCSQDFIIC